MRTGAGCPCVLSEPLTPTLGGAARSQNFLDAITDAREYDVPYHVRTAIDLDFRVGAWYEVSAETGVIHVRRLPEMLVKAEPRILAFDIECTKAPLKFPDSSVDQVFMISYMCDGQGFLIINREVVSKDVEDFEYTPKPEFPGPFTVFNEVWGSMQRGAVVAGGARLSRHSSPHPASLPRSRTSKLCWCASSSTCASCARTCL